MEEKLTAYKKVRRLSRHLVLAALVAQGPLAVAAQDAVATPEAQPLTISVHDAQFTLPALERLVAAYQQVDATFRAKVVLTPQASADATVALTAVGSSPRATALAGVVVLPVANTQSQLLRHKKVQRGLSDKLTRQLFARRDVLDILDATDDEATAAADLPGTVYTLTGKSAVTTQLLASQLQVSPTQLRGKKILGREENLLTAVKTHPDAVSYNVLPLLYDPQSRQPVSGITVLPTDLDGNGKVTDDERQAIARLDSLTHYLSRLPALGVPVGCVVMHTDNAALRQFALWVTTDGQSLLTDYGLLKANPPLTAKR